MMAKREPEPKDTMFLIRLGRTEVQILNDLAATSGLSRANVVRTLIRNGHSAWGLGEPHGLEHATMHGVRVLVPAKRRTKAKRARRTRR